MADFDPYHEWLGISPEERPINYYSLLSLRCFESNAKAISNAADRQMSFVRTFQTGPHSNESQRILNELSKARVTLLNPEKKKAYDAQLRKEQSARQVPLPPPLPPLKRPEPPVVSQHKRPEPMVQSVSKRPEPVIQITPKHPEPLVKPSPDQPIFSTWSFDPDDVQLRNALEVYKESQNPPWEILKQVLLTEKYHSVWKVQKELGTQFYQSKSKYYIVNNFILENATIAFLNCHVFLGVSNNYDQGDVYLAPSKVIFKDITEKVISLNASGALEIVISKVYGIADHALTMTNVVDWVWEHAKKNGGKDLRYKKNKKKHIVEYFKLAIYISNITFGSYLFGNERLAKLFVSALLHKEPSSIQFETKKITLKGKDSKIQTAFDYMQEEEKISRLKEGEFILRDNDDLILSNDDLTLGNDDLILGNDDLTLGNDDLMYLNLLADDDFSSLQSSEHRSGRENTEFFNFTDIDNYFTNNKKLTDEEIAKGCCGCFIVYIISCLIYYLIVSFLQIFNI